jgi:hypothetical protein
MCSLTFGQASKRFSRAWSASSFRQPGTESTAEDFDIRTHALGTTFARIHAPTAGRRSLGSGDRQAPATSIPKTAKDDDDQL